MPTQARVVWDTSFTRYDFGPTHPMAPVRLDLTARPDLMRRMQWREEAMRAALDPSMYATDLAVDLAREGLPFRDAYRQAADPARWAAGDPARSLAARTSPGAAGDLRLDLLQARLAALR